MDNNQTMGFCGKCGTPLVPGASFCGSCGAAVNSTRIAPESTAPAQQEAPPARQVPEAPPARQAAPVAPPVYARQAPKQKKRVALPNVTVICKRVLLLLVAVLTFAAFFLPIFNITLEVDDNKYGVSLSASELASTAVKALSVTDAEDAEDDRDKYEDEISEIMDDIDGKATSRQNSKLKSKAMKYASVYLRAESLHGDEDAMLFFSIAAPIVLLLFIGLPLLLAALMALLTVINLLTRREKDGKFPYVLAAMIPAQFTFELVFFGLLKNVLYGVLYLTECNGKISLSSGICFVVFAVFALLLVIGFLSCKGTGILNMIRHTVLAVTAAVMCFAFVIPVITGAVNIYYNDRDRNDEADIQISAGDVISSTAGAAVSDYDFDPSVQKAISTTKAVWKSSSDFHSGVYAAAALIDSMEEDFSPMPVIVLCVTILLAFLSRIFLIIRLSAFMKGKELKSRNIAAGFIFTLLSLNVAVAAVLMTDSFYKLSCDAIAFKFSLGPVLMVLCSAAMIVIRLIPGKKKASQIAK